MGQTNARLEANRKRREDLENDEPIEDGEDDKRLHMIPDIDINDEDLRKAMSYMQNAHKKVKP
jgi:hypothetical protein